MSSMSTLLGGLFVADWPFVVDALVEGCVADVVEF
jgi:hypothetical protein